MPDIPGRPTVRDKGGGGGGIEVTWNAVLPNNTGSVLYIVERRSHSGVGRHAHRQHVLDGDNTLTSPWQQTEQVTSLNDDHLSDLYASNGRVSVVAALADSL